MLRKALRPAIALALVGSPTSVDGSGTQGTADRLIVNRQDVRPPAQLAQIARAVGVEPHHHRQRTRRKPDPNTQT